MAKSKTQSLQYLTPAVISQLESFFESIPPHEFRENLIEIYLSYIRHEHESLPYNFKELAESMGMFFDFLKFVDEELELRRKNA